jgi:hypothetical protein
VPVAPLPIASEEDSDMIPTNVKNGATRINFRSVCPAENVRRPP